jgi:hypothetical protein
MARKPPAPVVSERKSSGRKSYAAPPTGDYAQSTVGPHKQKWYTNKRTGETFIPSGGTDRHYVSTATGKSYNYRDFRERVKLHGQTIEGLAAQRAGAKAKGYEIPKESYVPIGPSLGLEEKPKLAEGGWSAIVWEIPEDEQIPLTSAENYPPALDAAIEMGDDDYTFQVDARGIAQDWYSLKDDEEEGKPIWRNVVGPSDLSKAHPDSSKLVRTIMDPWNLGIFKSIDRIALLYASKAERAEAKRQQAIARANRPKNPKRRQ